MLKSLGSTGGSSGPSLPSTTVVNASGDTTGAADAAAINAAITALSAAGGGTVQLQSARYYVNATVTLANGVTLAGLGWIPGTGSTPLVTGGTIIQAVGSIVCVGYNTVDLGAPYANGALLLGSELLGGKITNFATQGGTYGVKIGAAYQGGGNNLTVSNVMAQGATQWGQYYENIRWSQLDTVKAYNNTNGIAFYASGGAFWNYGNLILNNIEALANANLGYNGYAVLVRSRLASNWNNVAMSNLTAIGINSSNTQAATMAASSTAIGVTDLSKYGLYMGVKFATSANGFTANQLYFVLSVTGASGAGSITVGNSPNAAAITATGATAVNILTSGFPIVAWDSLDSSFHTCHSLKGAADVEQGSVSHILIHNVSGFSFEFGFASGGGNSDICVRTISGNGNQLYCGHAETYDADTSGQSVVMIGSQPTNLSNFFQGIGITSAGLRISGNAAELVYNGTTSTLIASRQIILPSTAQATGATTGNNAETTVFTTAAGGTLTLHAVTALNAGQRMFISNPTANSVTVGTTSSQNIVGLGVSGTSITLATLTGACLIACNNAGTLYWHRIS